MRPVVSIQLQIIVLGAVLSAFQTAVAQTDGAIPTPAQSRDSAQVESVRTISESMMSAFNEGKVDVVKSMFLPTGELIDEAGTIYQGQQQIKELLTALFEKFPGVQLSVAPESIRVVGPTIIEEGTRMLMINDSKASARFRYIDVWVQAGSEWKLASHREFAEDPVHTANDYLQPLAWLEGSWINEGVDGTVAIQFKWSEEKNYLLGEFAMTDASGVVRKSTQRIGWDAKAGNIRSWLFDADGGFSEGVWTVLEDEVVIKSTSVNPSGSTASATLTLRQVDKDHFTFSGAERIVGGSREPDFELTITRKLNPVSK